MDPAYNFFFVFELEPSMDTVRLAKVLKRYVCATVELIRKAILVKDLHSESLCYILYFKDNLLIPYWFLTSIVDSFSLIFLFTKL